MGNSCPPGQWVQTQRRLEHELPTPVGYLKGNNMQFQASCVCESGWRRSLAFDREPADPSFTKP